MMLKPRFSTAPDRLAPADVTVSRFLAYAYAALDELEMSKRVVAAARAQEGARTSTRAQLDEVVDLMQRARALLKAVMGTERGEAHYS